MSSSRLDTLKSMLEQDPHNSFARYGLAMEYMNNGHTEAAVSEFRTLLSEDPDYSAAYFHAGRALEKLGQIDDARAVMEQGVEVTTRKGDMHTRSELQAALDMLGI